MLSIRAAVEAGAHYIEFDVQCAADLTPVVLHDDSMLRTSAKPGDVLKLRFEELKAYDVSESERLGAKYSGVHVPSLSEVVGYLENCSDVTAFLEVKIESMLHFGRDKVLDQILPLVIPLGRRLVVISYDVEVLCLVKERSDVAVGWVVEPWSAKVPERVNELSPEYIFCNWEKVPKGKNKLWPGGWHWVFYEVDCPEVALRLKESGAAMIESMAVAEMLSQKPFGRVAASDDAEL